MRNTPEWQRAQDSEVESTTEDLLFFGENKPVYFRGDPLKTKKRGAWVDMQIGGCVEIGVRPRIDFNPPNPE